MVAPNGNQLSEREKEILRLVATGASNKEIAAQLIISPNTVKVHLRNIFAKIGVASRTEATLYAIQQGLASVQPPASPGLPRPPAESDPVQTSTLVGGPPNAHIHRYRRRLYVSVAFVVLTLLAALGVASLRPSPTLTTPAAGVSTPAVGRWETRAPLATPRRGLAAAVYEGQIYAIGGEAVEGVSGAVERFDPDTNSWQTLASMPQPAAEISAVVIGGLIYVPGGRTVDGTPSDRLAVYDPRQDAWETRAALPRAVSGYALAAFEGKLYLFGGLSGQSFLDDVYVYTPDLDRWEQRTAMPTARAFAGAAVAGGRVYVIGGTDGAQGLTANEIYIPEADIPGGQPWQRGRPLPASADRLGAATLADMIYAVDATEAGTLMVKRIWLYTPQTDRWQPINTNSGDVGPMPGFQLAVIGSRLHAVGGKPEYSSHAAFQAISAVLLPLISK